MDNNFDIKIVDVYGEKESEDILFDVSLDDEKCITIRFRKEYGTFNIESDTDGCLVHSIEDRKRTYPDDIEDVKDKILDLAVSRIREIYGASDMKLNYGI